MYKINTYTQRTVIAVSLLFAAVLSFNTSAQAQTLDQRVIDLETQNAELQEQVAGLLHVTQYMFVEDTDVYFEGANVHITDGSGTTNCGGDCNGFGNLIVGYNEPGYPDWFGVLETTVSEEWSLRYHPKTGSHNVVVGFGHSYDSYGGLVAGRENQIEVGRQLAQMAGDDLDVVATDDCPLEDDSQLEELAGELPEIGFLNFPREDLVTDDQGCGGPSHQGRMIHEG